MAREKTWGGDGAMTPGELVFLNGEFLPAEKAVISIHDGGWLHGAGLFETMRAEHRRVFRLDDHLGRLRRSAESLLHSLSHDDLPTERVFRELLERNGFENARLRLTVTSGLVGAGAGPDQPRLTVCLSSAELQTYPQKLHEDGVAVIVSKYRQSPHDPTAGHKWTGYLPRLIALREAQSARCAEAIWFTTSHHLAEGSISNVFVVRDGVVRTPSLDTPVLPGVARGVVIELCTSLGLTIEQARLTIDDLLDADEVMLTNSIMQVLPVIRVERHGIGSGQPGLVTRKLRMSYRELVRQECNP